MRDKIYYSRNQKRFSSPNILISCEAQFNQVVKYLIKYTDNKFIDIREFDNNIVSINYYYKNELLLRVYGSEKVRIPYESYICKDTIIPNYHNCTEFKYNEIWNRHRIDKSLPYP